ncbi:MAG TPA: hypothetical protein VNU68_29160 [Verrucomicrobiae bacterium]|nr:hypothetical protein [Verrucomicrobiae bacterium]
MKRITRQRPLTDEEADKYRLSIWTIYERPKDYPRHFVVRRWTIGAGQERAHECQLADTLEEARKLVPPLLIRLDRQPNDDPVIVENWL